LIGKKNIFIKNYSNKKMLILAIGDPHFRPENAQATIEFTEKVTQLVLDKNPDVIVVLGDLLHTHEKLHSLVMNTALDFLDCLRKLKPTFILVGNHDMSSNTQFLNDNHWMNVLKGKENLTVVDRVVKYENIVLAPYVYPGRLKEALDTSPGWEKANIIFLHQEMKGCKMGAIISNDGDEWDENLPLIVSGHIHDTQYVGDNIYYPGSAIQHGFGETSKKIVALVSDKWEIEEVDLKLPKKKTIYIDSIDLRDFNLQQDDRVSYRLVVGGGIDDFNIFRKSKKYEKLKHTGMKIVFKHKKYTGDEANGDETNGDETNGDETKDETIKSFENILSKLIKESDNAIIGKVYEQLREDGELSETPEKQNKIQRITKEELEFED
jgi:DNA repair exonuclease SbcCD nuclease subunit